MFRSVLLVVLMVVSPIFVSAQIPTVERDALIALYTATNGAGWTDNTGWDTAIVDTECTWFGVTCSGGHVTQISLDLNQLNGTIPSEIGNLGGLELLYMNSNQLSGSIPPELGDLNSLMYVSIDSNQLSGNIPSELGNVPHLWYLSLGSNQLSGSIPFELGNEYLWYLRLDSNQLTGNIPSEFGNLSSLQYLWLNSNQLSGEIPTEVGNMSYLTSADIGFNALWTDDVSLQAFLYSKDPDWDQTQTIAPVDVAAGSETGLSFVVSWTPITYTAGDGGYLVSVAPASWIFTDSFETGDTSMWGEDDAIPIFVEFMTDSKTDSSILVDGLEPGTEYQFAVRTVTEPNANNQNQVVSEQSSAGLATTLPPLNLFYIDASTQYGMNPDYIVQSEGVDLIVRAYGGDKRITNAPLAIDVTIQSGGWERFEVRPSAPGVFVLDCEGCSPDSDTLTIDIH